MVRHICRSCGQAYYSSSEWPYPDLCLDCHGRTLRPLSEEVTEPPATRRPGKPLRSPVSASTGSLVIGLLGVPFAVWLLVGLVYTSIPEPTTGERPYYTLTLFLGVALSSLLLPLWMVGAVLGHAGRSGGNGTTLASVGLATSLVLVAVWVTVLSIRGGEVACSVSPCDAVYEYTVENHQARELRVHLNGLDPWSVKPCSVRVIETAAPGTFGRRVRFSATDQAGDSVYETTLNPPDLSGTATDTVRIPERQAGECPTLSHSDH
jgi:hypothetical protein